MKFNVAYPTRISSVIALVALVACGPDYPSCEEDSDCKAAEFCVNQMCQKCRNSADCQAGQQCVGGRCDPIAGYCKSASDCANGETCQNNRCIAAPSESLESSSVSEDTGCALRPVYFAYDSEALEPDAREGLSQNAKCVQERKLQSLHVTGYTDPRGTEEYNLALGDRRSRSATQYLKALGLDKLSISTSSMGEEMAHGTEEGSWTQDRKVELQAK